MPIAAAAVKLRAEALRVLIELGKYADPAGRCHPSRSRLAAGARVVRRNLIRNFRDLEAVGLLELLPDGSYQLIFEQHSPVLEQHSPVLEQHSPVLEQHSPVLEQHSPVSRVTLNSPMNSPGEQPTQQSMRAHTAPIIDQEGNEIAGNVLDDFGAAWSAYRHRSTDHKDPARQAWDQLMRQGVNPAVVIAAAERQATTIDDPRYAKHMDTWLSKRLFEDQQGADPSAYDGRSLTERAVSRIRLRDDGPGSTVAAAYRVMAAGPLRSTSSNDNPATAERLWHGRTFDEWREKLTEYRRRRDEGALMAVWFEMAPGWGLAPENNASRAPPRLRQEFGFD